MKLVLYAVIRSAAVIAVSHPIIALRAQAQTPACAEVPAGAVAWWRAESNRIDTISINDAFLPSQQRETISYMPGKVGAAFRFLRTNSISSNLLYVQASAELNIGGADGLTIEGWIRPVSVSPALQPILEWNDGRGNIGAGLALSGSSLEADFTDTNAPSIQRVVLGSASGLVVTSVWQHVAVTFNRSDGLATLYINGTSVGQTNLGSFQPQTRAAVYLASRLSGIGTGSAFAGGLDELTIYNRALSTSEIEGIVTADAVGKCVPTPNACAPAPPDLVGWWRGESNSFDSADNNAGVIIPLVSYRTGIAGQAFDFSTGYVRIAASDALDVGTAPGLTIEAWVFPEIPLYVGDGSVRPGSREFVGWHSGTVTQGVSLSLSYQFNVGSVAFGWKANLVDIQGQPHVIRAPSGLGALEGWQHLAVTYDKPSGVAAFYFNGNLVTVTNFGAFTPQTGADLNLGYLFPLPFPLISGRTGAMDELSIYSRALSPLEIREIMKSRNAGKCKDPPSITTQPANVRVNQGNDAVFAVAAYGNPILKYRWRYNGTNTLSATSSSLVLSNVQPSQAGDYSVRVTNVFGAVVSSNAILLINRPPLADASATIPVVILPLDCGVATVLDGSRSSDPDGDSLRYLWFVPGTTTPLATGAVAVVSLPPGINQLELTVDDGLATNSHTFTVEVITSAEAVARLLDSVHDASNAQPLIASLLAARAAVARDNAIAAANELKAFQNKIDSQLAQVEPELAQQLIQSSQKILNVLSYDCVGLNKQRPAISNVLRTPTGHTRIHFTCAQGVACIIEASTNLVDWEKIGAVLDFASTELDFEDSKGATFPKRFYRLVVP